jgi:hypothetical protein
MCGGSCATEGRCWRELERCICIDGRRSLSPEMLPPATLPLDEGGGGK